MQSKIRGDTLIRGERKWGISRKQGIVKMIVKMTMGGLPDSVGVRTLDTQPRLPLGGGSEGVQGGFPLKRDARMVCL